MQLTIKKAAHLLKMHLKGTEGLAFKFFGGKNAAMTSHAQYFVPAQDTRSNMEINIEFTFSVRFSAGRCSFVRFLPFLPNGTPCRRTRAVKG